MRIHEPFADLEKAGLAGFAPFAAEHDAEAPCVAEIHLDRELHTGDFEVEILSEFDFPDARCDCFFGRCAEGYLFYMRPYGCQSSGNDTLFTMSTETKVVESNIACGGAPDPSLLRFGLWMMFGLAINPLHAIAIHSSVIVKHGGAVMFLGESGTGKSTHTRLWRENIDKARLLNDDSPIIRCVDGTPMVFGSAWSGKTPCYVNRGFPIRGIVRLSQAPHNRMRRLPLLNALGALLPSCPPAFAYDDLLQDRICETLSEVLSQVPVYHLECLPDADAARLSYRTVFNIAE